MSQKDVGFGVVYTAKDSMTAVVKKLGKAVGAVTTQVGGLAKGAASAGLALGGMVAGLTTGGLTMIAGGIASIVSGLVDMAREGRGLLLDFNKKSALLGAQAGLTADQMRRANSEIIKASTGTGAEFDESREVLKELLSTGIGFDEAMKKLGKTVSVMKTFGMSPQQVGSFETAKTSIGLTDKAMEGLMDQALATQKAFGNIPIGIENLPKIMLNVQDKLSFLKLTPDQMKKTSLSVLQLGAAFTKGLGLPAEEAAGQATEFFELMASNSKEMSQAFAGLGDGLGGLTEDLSVLFRDVGKGMKSVKEGAQDPVQFISQMSNVVGKASKLSQGEQARLRTFIEKSFGPKTTQLIYKGWGKVQGVFGKDLPKALAKSAGLMKQQEAEAKKAAYAERIERGMQAMKMRLGAMLLKLEVAFRPLVNVGMKFLNNVITPLAKKGGPVERLAELINVVFPGDMKPKAEAVKAAFGNLVDSVGAAFKEIWGIIKESFPWQYLWDGLVGLAQDFWKFLTSKENGQKFDAVLAAGVEKVGDLLGKVDWTPLFVGLAKGIGGLIWAALKALVDQDTILGKIVNVASGGMIGAMQKGAKQAVDIGGKMSDWYYDMTHNPLTKPQGVPQGGAPGVVKPLPPQQAPTQSFSQQNSTPGLLPPQPKPQMSVQPTSTTLDSAAVSTISKLADRPVVIQVDMKEFDRAFKAKQAKAASALGT
jgi:hypothetical protein